MRLIEESFALEQLKKSLVPQSVMTILTKQQENALLALTVLAFMENVMALTHTASVVKMQNFMILIVIVSTRNVIIVQK